MYYVCWISRCNKTIYTCIQIFRSSASGICISLHFECLKTIFDTILFIDGLMLSNCDTSIPVKDRPSGLFKQVVIINLKYSVSACIANYLTIFLHDGLRLDFTVMLMRNEVVKPRLGLSLKQSGLLLLMILVKLYTYNNFETLRVVND